VYPHSAYQDSFLVDGVMVTFIPVEVRILLYVIDITFPGVPGRLLICPANIYQGGTAATDGTKIYVIPAAEEQ